MSLEIQALPYPGHSPCPWPSSFASWLLPCQGLPACSGKPLPVVVSSMVCGGRGWRSSSEKMGAVGGAVWDPVSALFTTPHFLPLSSFSNCCCFCFLLPPLPLCPSLSLSLQPLATLSAFLASLGPPRPPHLPIMPPGPSLALRPRDWVWGASQPGLGALSGRQWCRRPLQLRPSRRA